MLLSFLLKTALPAGIDREVSRLMLDSRQVKPGDLFFALKGAHVDGRRYMADAVKTGVAAILVEGAAGEVITIDEQVPIVPVQGLAQQLGEIAARFYDHPATKLRMIGVTGTNGKTSCTQLIAQGLEVPCGIIGTLGSGFYGQLVETGWTTPDALTLQANLKQFVEKGAEAVAMEVSSHSIDQGRVNAVPFEIGIFTNLTQDHLDYHGDMETYAKVKRRFLTDWPIKHLIMNVDDVYGRRWVQEMASSRPIFAYSTKQVALPAKVQGVYAEQINLSLQGIRARVITPWGCGQLHLPLIGQFNLSNALAVLTALCLYGIPFGTVLERLEKLKAVPGRMQTLGGQEEPLVVVDYSHTPDALESALRALRPHTSGKLICVFGCGGDRDASKRPKMSQIAEELADVVIVTNDNPRHEKPEEIIQQIMQGFNRPERVLVEFDRAKAIEKSIQLAGINDCILIAGKGAERYQQMGDEKIPFDDVERARHYLGMTV
ncbi:MAG: UDP-N-acetylmuramoyl-L-alanyl-D-glutamate--2,6-diaminopimelate ligase [Gammaproteobacteria bacterium]